MACIVILIVVVVEYYQYYYQYYQSSVVLSVFSANMYLVVLYFDLVGAV